MASTAPTGAVLPPPAARRLELDVLGDIVTGLSRAESLWRPHVAHDRHERVRRRLLATPAYEVWLLGWTPGQSVGLHDHGAANGAFVVVDGELAETTVDGARLDVERLPAGQLGQVPAGSIHDVGNRSARNATSIHVYSHPLSAMSFYGANGRLVRVEAVHEQSALVDAASWAHVLHPSGANIAP
jgi:quercetin dioxygenase-like cupin family protein